MAAPARTLSPPAPARRRPAPSPTRGAPSRDRPAASSVRPAPRRARRSGAAFWVFAVVLVGGLVLALVSAQAFVAQSSFRTSELERRVEELKLEHGGLRLRVAELAAPDRLAARAARQGMRLPDQVQTVRVPGAGTEAPAAQPPPRGPAMALKGLLEGSR